MPGRGEYLKSKYTGRNSTNVRRLEKVRQPWKKKRKRGREREEEEKERGKRKTERGNGQRAWRHQLCK